MKKQAPTMHQANQAYQRYVKPLEQNYKGQFAGVSYTGKIIIAPTLLKAIEQSAESFGKSNSFVFKIGDKVVGRL